jgi:arylsulfatase A-like enzyme
MKMNGKTMKNIRTLIAALLLATPAALHAAGAPAKTGGRPNIVLIMADDLGYGALGCYGNKEIKTPNIDALATGGVRLTDFHSNGPMCTPTRAALMTGRYQQRCAWVSDEELSPRMREQRKQNLKQRWGWGISPQELTLPRLLQQSGYRTAIFGKWHLGYDFKFHPMNYGFDEFRGYIGGAVDYHSHVATHGTEELDWWQDKLIENQTGYTTDLLTKYSTHFIERNKSHSFYLYLAHEAVHDPLQGRDPSKKQSPKETYKEMIEVLDESVGAVVQALRKNNLENNTLVIFCSDNGPIKIGAAANASLKGTKGSMFEGGHRVPFIAHWPGVIPAGQTNSRTVMSMDLLPTFAKLAGTSAPENHPIDGVDILPLLKDPSKQTDRVLHWLFGSDWAVRKGAWKLIGKSDRPLTLVNLEADIEEKQNLIKEKPGLVGELMKLHHQWIAEVGNR